MPNHCTNTVEIAVEDDAKRAEILELLTVEREDKRTGEKRVDVTFNKLRPMPEILTSIKKGGCCIDGELVSIWVDTEERDKNGKPVRRKLTAEEEAEIAKIGHTDWHDWSVSKWGTKWDAYGCRPPMDTGYSLKLVFDTAWGPPLKVFDALRERYAEVEDFHIAGFYLIEGYEAAGVF